MENEKHTNKLLTYVKCLNCDEKIVSNHSHDYKFCGCENKTMIDGGQSYTKYGGLNMNMVEVNELYSDSPFELIRELLSRGGRGINGDQPLEYVTLKDINDEWLKSIIKYEEYHRPNNRYLQFFRKEVSFRRDMLIESILEDVES